MKYLLGLLAILFAFPAFAQSSTASLLGVYTTDNVPALTFGYTDQFGNFTGGSIKLRGSTSGTATLQGPSTGGGTITLPVGTGSLAASALATSTTSTALTSTTTLTAITGLSVPVAAGATYYCTAALPITADSSGGAKVAFAGANSMTATSANYTALTTTTTVNNAATNTTTFGNAVGGYTGAATNVALQGTIVVNAGGNLIVQGAENASDSSATTFLANSSLVCIRTN